MAIDTTKSVDELKQKVQDLKESITARAQKIVHEVMPAKVLELNQLYTTHPKFNTDMNEVRKPVGFDKKTLRENAERMAKKRKLSETKEKDDHNDSYGFDFPEVPSNEILCELMAVLKKEILGLIEMINTVKIWIQLNIPRIEDGNNFGVSIQEETVNELSRAEDSGFAVLESMTKYFVTRAKLISKVVKYPTIEDYQQSVLELDEKEYINLRLCALDLRNNYTILHDMIIKNLEKLKTPRTSHHMAAIF